MKTPFFLVLMTVMSVHCFAEDEGVRLIPMLNYDFMSLESQKDHAPGGGLILLSGDHEPPLSENYDPYGRNLLVGLFYKPHLLRETFPGYEGKYHDIDFIVERKWGPHLIQGIFSTYTDQPVYGGFHTTYTSLGYGYELMRRENVHLTLGLALGAGDYGINLPGSGTWPVLPMPIIRFGLNLRNINFALDFPEFRLIVLPKSKIRLTGAVRLNIYTFYDIHDLRFNAILWYRFFDTDFTAGDFLGIGVGVQNTGQNDGTDFALGEKGKTYDMNYYSVFGVLDAGLVKLTGGYVFYSREVYDSDYSRPAGNGFFIKVEMLYQFKLK